jgi:hypothetical protein
MKFPTLLFHVSIHIAMFAMPIRIPPCLGYGYPLIVSFLASFFLAHVLLSFLGVQINVEILFAFLVYAFHTMKLQLSSDMVENSSKVLHHHSRLFQRCTQSDGLPLEIISLFLHFLDLLLMKVLSLHEFLLFVSHGIEF